MHQQDATFSERQNLNQQILDTALSLAEKTSWDSVRLYDVATQLDISLDQLRGVYAQKDDLSEAWFDRADQAMLEDSATGEFLQLPSRDRLHRAIMCWLNAMSAHKHLTAEMLRYKLEPGHIHLQALGVTRISRTVQWIMEAAQRDSIKIQRTIEELVFTMIYLAAFSFWLRDASFNSQRTARFLESMLEKSESMSHFFLKIQ